MANQEPQPTLRPTAYSTLVVCALAAGAITLGLVSRFYQNVPELAWYNPVALLILALVLANVAYMTRRRIRKPGEYAPVQPLQVARFAVLGKATAIGGALFFGAYSGFTIWAAVQAPLLDAAADDVPPGLFGVVACLMLTAAALWLERSCRIPDDEESDLTGQPRLERPKDNGE
ncbi:DUF3180 domain-containing protein [Natronoglycomyces albus]|uniref:DUF3180 domain-containing protein n=1 Tax=Natronoglycomyces albus TaxID=2811108 RepID=A0A895XIM1_9ACTN|nr:DUF3180 domain-containing protein [Natronoglycomyces albus]QSB05651.1 DUF3180 domain-containing protein [Natronoglycomyces albus]